MSRCRTLDRPCSLPQLCPFLQLAFLVKCPPRRLARSLPFAPNSRILSRHGSETTHCTIARPLQAFMPSQHKYSGCKGSPLQACKLRPPPLPPDIGPEMSPTPFRYLHLWVQAAVDATPIAGAPIKAAIGGRDFSPKYYS